MGMLNESEWLTRKKRIDTRLCALTPPWKIIRYHDGLNLSSLHCIAVEEFPTANGPADEPAEKLLERIHSTTRRLQS
jgi:hypothetical protein